MHKRIIILVKIISIISIISIFITCIKKNEFILQVQHKGIGIDFDDNLFSRVAFIENGSTALGDFTDSETITVEFKWRSVVIGDYYDKLSLNSDEDVIKEKIYVRWTIEDTTAKIWWNNITNDNVIYKGEYVEFNVTWKDTVDLNY